MPPKVRAVHDRSAYGTEMMCLHCSRSSPSLEVGVKREPMRASMGANNRGDAR